MCLVWFSDICATHCWLCCIQFWTTKACCLLNCWLLYLFLWRLVASATTVLLENNIIEGVGSGWQFYLLCQYLKLQGTHSIFHYCESARQSLTKYWVAILELSWYLLDILEARINSQQTDIPLPTRVHLRIQHSWI